MVLRVFRDNIVKHIIHFITPLQEQCLHSLVSAFFLSCLFIMPHYMSLKRHPARKGQAWMLSQVPSWCFFGRTVRVQVCLNWWKSPKDIGIFAQTGKNTNIVLCRNPCLKKISSALLHCVLMGCFVCVLPQSHWSSLSVGHPHTFNWSMRCACWSELAGPFRLHCQKVSKTQRVNMTNYDSVGVKMLTKL